MISPATERMLLRGVHIVFGLPILGYVYGPPEEVAPYVNYFRLLFVPVLVLSGIWLWKGHLVRRMLTKRAA